MRKQVEFVFKPEARLASQALAKTQNLRASPAKHKDSERHL